MSPLLTIGKVAGLTGVSADTIRYYERLGLLPKATRTPAGYRQYPEGVATRLALVRNAQQFGFSLREIAAFLRVREAGGVPCRDVRAAAQRMLEAADQQIADLVAAREHMRETLTAWDERLTRTPHGSPARLLEALAPSIQGRAVVHAARLTRGMASARARRGIP
jgi:MerR family transcriptional regulator, copper efflux regulator